MYPLAVMIMVAGEIEIPLLALMLGTTLPTEGTGLVIRGDIEGMLANCDNRVTPPLVSAPLSSPSPSSV